MKKIDKSGLKIVNERYSTNKGGKQMFGEMAIEANDLEMRMAVGFRNSIDKSLPVGFVAGAQVIVCSNLMLKGDIKQVRRHTLNVKTDLEQKFELIQGNLEATFGEMRIDVERFKNTNISYEKSAELFGKIILREKGVATIQQTTRALELFKNPIHNFGNTEVWGFYNSFTEAYKEAHPWKAPQNYLNLHSFLKKEFELK